MWYFFLRKNNHSNHYSLPYILDEIVEGTLEWNYTGTVDDQSYTYSVIIVYQGNGMAELIINGIKYIINTSSGEIE